MYLADPEQHHGVPLRGEVHSEEPRDQESQQLRVKQNVLRHPELPSCRVGRGWVSVLAASCSVKVSPGLDEGQPGLYHYSEAGIVGRMGENVPARKHWSLHKEFCFNNGGSVP